MSERKSQRGRGRPVNSAEHIADMRARIAGQAQELFLREGYGAVSMRRIAMAAGCTVMTLYRYYDRKIDILRHLWALVFGMLFDELEQIADAERDPEQRLEAVALGYVRFWLEHRDLYFMVFMSSNVDQADVSIFVEDDTILERFRIFERCLVLATSAGEPPSDMAVKSELLLCTLNGIAHNLITISGYPWSKPQVLVRTAICGLLSTSRHGRL